MKPIPGKISNKEFKKILSDKRGVLRKKVIDGLKTAGMQGLLYEKEVTEQQAMKALKTLQKQGSLTDFKRPDQLYREAGIAQRDFDEAQRNATIKKHARFAIKSELEEEAYNLEHGLDRLKHDERSVLGKSVYQRLNEEQDERKKKVDDQTKKKEKYDNKGSAKSNKPELANLPDMEIG